MSGHQRQQPQRGRGHGNRSHQGRARRQTVQQREEPKPLNDYQQADWEKLINRTAVLRGWRTSSIDAEKKAFVINPDIHRDSNYEDLCQHRGYYTNSIQEQSNTQRGDGSQAQSKDRGLHGSAGGGMPGAQGSASGNISKQAIAAQNYSQADTAMGEGRDCTYVGATLFLSAPNLALSNQCKTFFNEDWDARLHELIGSPPSRHSYNRRMQHVLDQTAALKLDSSRKKFTLAEHRETMLNDFHHTFGSKFYRRVKLGAFYEKRATSHQHDASQAFTGDKTRQISADLAGEGPNARVAAGGHTTSALQQKGSESISRGGQGSLQRSYGGPADLARFDQAAWRDAVKVPETWARLQDFSEDCIALLQLVNDVARRQSAPRDSPVTIIKTYERSSVLLDEMTQRDRTQELRRLCLDTVKIRWEPHSDRHVFYIKHEKSITEILLTFYHRDGSSKSKIYPGEPRTLRQMEAVIGHDVLFKPRKMPIRCEHHISYRGAWEPRNYEMSQKQPLDGWTSTGFDRRKIELDPSKADRNGPWPEILLENKNLYEFMRKINTVRV